MAGRTVGSALLPQEPRIRTVLSSGFKDDLILSLISSLVKKYLMAMSISSFEVSSLTAG
jgi:hypothetical protein